MQQFSNLLMRGRVFPLHLPPPPPLSVGFLDILCTRLFIVQTLKIPTTLCFINFYLGVAFGKGVYFARDASMSASYAHAMPNRMRYMYYTRVAVGQCALGNPSMLVPPAKGGTSNDSYDSTVNNPASPTVFVLFYDNQYYPEYLITFT
jgi:hypothetical protein